MSLIEAVLVYRPPGAGGGGEAVPLGRTADPRALRVIRTCLLRAARAEARFWRDVDPGVATLRAAEAERLGHVLDTLMPEGPAAGLQLVPRNGSTVVVP